MGDMMFTARPLTDAIEEMAAGAKREIYNAFGTTPLIPIQPILARHFEAGVRELVLAAREIGWAMPKVFPATDYSNLVCESCHGTGEHQSEIVHDDSCPWTRLRAALEQFKEVR